MLQLKDRLDQEQVQIGDKTLFLRELDGKSAIECQTSAINAQGKVDFQKYPEAQARLIASSLFTEQGEKAYTPKTAGNLPSSTCKALLDEINRINGWAIQDGEKND